MWLAAHSVGRAVRCVASLSGCSGTHGGDTEGLETVTGDSGNEMVLNLAGIECSAVDPLTHSGSTASHIAPSHHVGGVRSVQGKLIKPVNRLIQTMSTQWVRGLFRAAH